MKLTLNIGSNIKKPIENTENFIEDFTKKINGILKGKGNDEQIYNEISSLLAHSFKNEKQVDFLDYLKSIFDNLNTKNQTKITFLLYQKNVDKEKVYLFFKKICLKNLINDKTTEKQWDKIWKYINNDKYIKLQKKEKKLNEGLKTVLKNIKNINIKKPYKNEKFLEENKKFINEEILKKYIKSDKSHISYNDNYKISRVFLELAKNIGEEKKFFENEEAFSNFNSGFQQKVLELALKNNENIKDSFLGKFLEKIKKEKKKTTFQKKLIKLAEENQ